MTRGLIAAVYLILCGLCSGPTTAKTYIAFGDSITRGDSGPNDTDEIDFDKDGKGYPNRLQKLLNNGDKVRNEGIGSLDSMEALQGPIQEALNRGGDVLLLMIGTNDVKPISRMERSVDNVRFNLDSLRKTAAAQGMPTIMATLIHRVPNATYDRFNTATFAIVAAIRELEARNGRQPVADVWEVFDRIPDDERFRDFYFHSPTGNIGHPNSEGFQLIAETFKEIILGDDTLEPLFGSLTPRARDTEEVSNTQEFRLVLYDHLSGIDRRATTFLVNGKVAEDTDVTATGDRKKATLTLTLSKFEDCKLRLEVLSQERADPPNILDLHLKDFGIIERGFKKGDVDFDCRVDGVDLVLFAFHFGTSEGEPRYDIAADFDKNGEIDGLDLAIFSDNFGKTAK